MKSSSVVFPLPLVGLLLLSATCLAEEDSWKITLGGGFIYSPSYLGDDDYQLSAVPNVRVQYGDRFFASKPEGLGYRLIKNEKWEFGPLVKYEFGRDEDGDRAFRIAGSTTDDLRGLGDVDGTVELGFFASYTAGSIETRMELRQGINGHDGLVGEAEIKYNGAFSFGKRRGFFSIGPKITFGDSSYTSSYFDVTASQSLASGLSVFDADGGISSYGLHLSFVLPLNEKLTLVSYARYDRLAGDIEDSSLVRERGSRSQGSFGVFLGYSF